LIALIVLFGVEGPIRWFVAAAFFASLLVDAVVWWQVLRRRSS
jgi:hypothetical protein